MSSLCLTDSLWLAQPKHYINDYMSAMLKTSWIFAARFNTNTEKEAILKEAVS